MDPLRATRRRAPSVEVLEPRLLFSGDAAGAAVGEAIAWAAPAAAPEAAVVWTAPADTGLSQQAGAPRELAVVDARVPDVGRLLADLDAQRVAGRPIDVVVLGAGEDALQVLDAELAATDVPYRAVHFFGHGTAGSMQLGATALDLATVRANADAIAGWSAGLTADADLLLWGCDTGAGTAGPALLDALAGLTGADVAASDDATGGLAHGADWMLEVAHGAIETQAPIGAALQAGFDGVLAAESAVATAPVVVPTESGGRRIAGNPQAGSITVVVWVDAATDDVMAQRYDAAGAALGGAITVAAGAGRTPAVAMDAAGNFIVVWQDSPDGFGQILAQRYLADGTPVGSLLAVTDDADDGPMQPAVAMNASGDAVVVWVQEGGNGANLSDDIVYRRISAAGVLGADVQDLVRNSARSGDQTLPAVAMQGNQGFAVAYLDVEDGNAVKVVVVPDATDRPNGSVPVTLSGIGFAAYAAPAIAALGSGGYVVAWSGDPALAADAVVQAVVIDGAGVAGTVYTVSDAPVGVGAETPSLAVAAGDAAVVVAWEQDDGSGPGIRARAFVPGAAPTLESVAVNTVTADSQSQVSAAIVGGMLRVSWTGPSTDAIPVERTWLRTMSLPTRDLVVTWPATRTTSEADGTTGGTTVMVALAMPPAGTVTVRVSVLAGGATEATVAGSGVLVFDASNWDQPQAVTIRGLDESRPLDDGDRTFTVRVAIDPAGSIADWHGAAVQQAAFSNLDNDAYSEFVVTTNLDVDDVARAPGAPLTPYDLWLHAQAGNTVSLREALLAANHQAEAPGERDRIRFALPPGDTRIVLGSALDRIVHAVDIDGGAPTTPGGPLNVELTDSVSIGNGFELYVGSDGSRIANLSIGGFSGNAVLVQSSDNVIENNHLGVNASGTGAFGNGQRGLSLWDNEDAVAVARNVITNNVIGANLQGGIRILGGEAFGNVVQGNFIGTDRSRLLDLGNGDVPGVDPFPYGILLTNGAHDNLIGGPADGQGNVLRFNGDRGIVVMTASSEDNALLRNVIDTDGTAIVRGGGARTVATPALSNAEPGETAGVTLVDVVLTGTAGTYYRLDFYVDRTAFVPGSTVPVDAQTWISGVSHRVVQIGSNGRWSGTVSLSTAADYTMAVTATATETNAAGSAFGETSALSAASRVNSVPVFQSTSNLSVAENTNPAATGPYRVATLQAVDPDAPGGRLIWSISGGDDGARFSIDAATGVLSFKAPPNFEVPTDANASNPLFRNTYEVYIRTVDALGGQKDRRYVVTVTNVNESPTLTLSPATLAVTEDTPLLLRTAGSLSASDPDAPSEFRRNIIIVSVERGLLTLGSLPEEVELREGSAAGSSRFVFAGSTDDLRQSLATLGYRPAADDTGDVTLSITVRDRYTSLLSSSGTVTLRIAAVNDAPVLVTAPPETPIDLRATGSLAIDGTLLTATDVDDGASQVVYTLQSGATAGQLLRDGTAIATGGTFTQADVDAGRMSFLAPTQGGFQQLTLAVSDAANASAAGGPVTLKLSIQSLAAAASAPAAPSSPAASSSASAPSSASSTSSPSSTTAQGASGAPAGAGDAAAADGSAAGARAGATPSGAGSGGQSAAARASVQGGPATGGTASTGAIATQAGGGADPGAGRQEASGLSRDASGAPLAGGIASTVAGTSLWHSNDQADRVRSATAGMTAGALADAWRRADALQAAEQAAEIQQAWSPVVALRQADFREELAQSREDVASKFQASSALVASSVAISTSLSLGYAIWLLRGGVLLTSLLASMPAWRSIDPLPVLARIDARGQDDGDEDDSLRGLLQRAADEQAERVAEAEAEAQADRVALPAGRLAQEMT